MAGQLIIICGMSGAGKTTLARQLESELDATRMSADDQMIAEGTDVWDGKRRNEIEAEQWNETIQLLRDGQVVVIEWGMWGRNERDHYREQASAVGATVGLIYLDAPDDVLWERIEKRDMESKHGSRAITRADVAAWREKFDAPDEAEGRLFDNFEIK